MGPSYAGILGSIAFVLVLVRGLIDGSTADTVLASATVSLLAFAAIGYVIGRIADQVVVDSVKQRLDRELKAFEKKESPAPQAPAADASQ